MPTLESGILLLPPRKYLSSFFVQTVFAIEANSQSVKGGKAKKSEEHEERD